MALAEGWATVRAGDTLVQLPMADGGEGTIDAFERAIPGVRRIPVTVDGPDDRPIASAWLLLPDGSAVIELASTSGITLLDPLQPHAAHTRGFGQAIAAALDGGARRLLLAVGGSASTDGGAGMLEALGARFLNEAGGPVGPGNAGLRELANVDLSGLRPLPADGVLVLCDVTNPLLGSRGAAAVFGPQKGAAVDDVPRLEAGLSRLAQLLPGTDPATPGAGAAGGCAFGLLQWGACLAAGSRTVAATIGLGDAIRNADAIVTGEGSFDNQSAAGKVVSQVLAESAAAGCQVFLVAGRISAPTTAFADHRSLSEIAGSGSAAIADSVKWLRAAGAALATDYPAGLGRSA
jgi:glycerate kinase